MSSLFLTERLVHGLVLVVTTVRSLESKGTQYRFLGIPKIVKRPCGLDQT